MAKQKIVVKVTMKNNKKSRKAMQIAANISGVESVAIVNKELISVIGERVDSVELTRLLRKGVGHAELVSVGPLEEKKPPKPPSSSTVTATTTASNQNETVRCECVCREHYCYQAVPFQVIHEVEVPSNTCSIL